MNKLEYLYVPKEGDKERVASDLSKLELKSRQELIDAYNGQLKVGVVGARAQMLFLVALRLAMIKCFGHSPIYVKDKYVLGIEGEVKLDGNDYSIKPVSPVIQFDWVSVPEEEKQTIIHCTHYAEPRFLLGGWINISPKTYLKSKDSKDILPLVQAIGVPVAPDKHFYNGHHESLQFTLLFKGLPRNWSSFSFIEEAKEGKQFVINDIPRNELGVYKIRL